MADEEISIEELIRRIDLAREKMSAKNPTRHLLLQCRSAIVYLGNQAPEQQDVRTAGGIILP